MSTTPKTIQIFFPAAEPHGIRIGEITTRIVQVIEEARSLLARFLAIERSSQVGVWGLIEKDSATAAGSKQVRTFCSVPAAAHSLRAIPAQGVYAITNSVFAFLCGAELPLCSS
jgi:hypothetical protein